MTSSDTRVAREMSAYICQQLHDRGIPLGMDSALRVTSFLRPQTMEMILSVKRFKGRRVPATPVAEVSINMEAAYRGRTSTEVQWAMDRLERLIRAGAPDLMGISIGPEDDDPDLPEVLSDEDLEFVLQTYQESLARQQARSHVRGGPPPLTGPDGEARTPGTTRDKA